MYDIYADDLCIYSDDYISNNTKLISPKLSMADNTAGSLTMTIPPSNIGYSAIQRMTTYLTVFKNKKEIWSGRILSETKDFWDNRVVVCEGELAYLNDTTQPQAEFHDITVRDFLSTLINIHNSKVTADKKFTVGVVTVTDPNNSLYRYTNHEKTIECINDKLINRLGGHLRIRKENGIRYLDYLADYINLNSQKIEFGTNLLDFTRKRDMSEYATVILPFGSRLETSPIPALEAYLTVDSVNNGSSYVKSDEAVSSYGWIEKTVKWDDVKTPEALLGKAKLYLSNLQFDNMIIELNAIDMNYLNPNIEDVKLLDTIEVISKPHGMNKTFPVTKLDIPLDQPEGAQFTLGTNIKTSLTEVNNKINTQIIKEIESLPKADTILNSAQEMATKIMKLATNGYITITTDQHGTNTLYISDNVDYTKATRLWKWNINGLAYSKDGGQSYGLAMTMDGSIVADFITSGSLNANLIKAGVINGIYIKGSRIDGASIYGGSLSIGTNSHYSTINDRGQFESHYKNDNYDYITMRLHPYEYDFDGDRYIGLLEFFGTDHTFINGAFYQNTTGGVTLGYSTTAKNFRLDGRNNSGSFIFRKGLYIEVGSDPTTECVAIAGAGGLRVVGAKNAVVKTDNYGNRLLYSYECDKVYFATLGEGELVNGECTIELDPMFMETIETDYYHIILTPKNKFLPLYYTDVTDSGFKVKADGCLDGKFCYTLSAIRKGYKETYLEQDTTTKI